MFIVFRSGARVQGQAAEASEAQTRIQEGWQGRAGWGKMLKSRSLAQPHLKGLQPHVRLT